MFNKTSNTYKEKQRERGNRNSEPMMKDQMVSFLLIMNELKQHKINVPKALQIKILKKALEMQENEAKKKI